MDFQDDSNTTKTISDAVIFWMGDNNMQNSKKRVLYMGLDIIKAFAIVAVVFFHMGYLKYGYLFCLMFLLNIKQIILS